MFTEEKSTGGERNPALISDMGMEEFFAAKKSRGLKNDSSVAEFPECPTFKEHGNARKMSLDAFPNKPRPRIMVDRVESVQASPNQIFST